METAEKPLWEGWGMVIALKPPSPSMSSMCIRPLTGLRHINTLVLARILTGIRSEVGRAQTVAIFPVIAGFDNHPELRAPRLTEQGEEDHGQRDRITAPAIISSATRLRVCTPLVFPEGPMWPIVITRTKGGNHETMVKASPCREIDT